VARSRAGSPVPRRRQGHAQRSGPRWDAPRTRPAKRLHLCGRRSGTRVAPTMGRRSEVWRSAANGPARNCVRSPAPQNRPRDLQLEFVPRLSLGNLGAATRVCAPTRCAVCAHDPRHRAPHLSGRVPRGHETPRSPMCSRSGAPGSPQLAPLGPVRGYVGAKHQKSRSRPGSDRPGSALRRRWHGFETLPLSSRNVDRREGTCPAGEARRQPTHPGVRGISLRQSQ
jgi:hypothetical protein